MKVSTNAIAMSLIAITILFIISLPIASWVLSSYFEASAFNRVTGKNVSTFDAMFIELRVQETPE